VKDTIFKNVFVFIYRVYKASHLIPKKIITKKSNNNGGYIQEVGGSLDQFLHCVEVPYVGYFAAEQVQG
jgi:hypothetical protein